MGCLVCSELFNGGYPTALALIVNISMLFTSTVIPSFVLRYSWRTTLIYGDAIGFFGLAILVVAIEWGETHPQRAIFLAILGSMLMGAARAAAQFYRFAMLDLSVPSRRASALGYMFLAGTFGGLLGPELLIESKRFNGLSALITQDLVGGIVMCGFVQLAGLVVLVFGMPRATETSEAPILPAAGGDTERGGCCSGLPSIGKTFRKTLPLIWSNRKLFVAVLAGSLAFGLMLLITVPAAEVAVDEYNISHSLAIRSIQFHDGKSDEWLALNFSHKISLLYVFFFSPACVFLSLCTSWHADLRQVFNVASCHRRYPCKLDHHGRSQLHWRLRVVLGPGIVHFVPRILER